MLQDGKLYIGTSRNPDDSINAGEYLDLGYANRHGLITGATGTGKTVTLQILAEGFSNAGVPVFCADVKGDLLALLRSANTRTSSRSAPTRSVSIPTSSRNSRWCSGISSAKRAIASAPA